MNVDEPTDGVTRADHVAVPTTLEQSQAADEQDPLAHLRDRFHRPQVNGREALYLCGNSLGLQPVGTRERVTEVLDAWASRGVNGHFDGEYPWVAYHAFAREGLAQLTGAAADEVVAMNSLTTNLHLMLASFYRPSGSRRRIVIEAGAFPSDRYAVASHLQVRGEDPKECLVELQPRAGESCLRTLDICAQLGELGDSVALVMLPGVQYYTGEVYDIAGIADAAHGIGARVGFDLAHAIGNVELSLHDWNADFAVWCTYKYLNSGPGSIAGAFVHERHGRSNLPRLAGWWGHDAQSRFAMGPEFVATPGADGWQLSNPPVFAIAPLLASLDVFSEVGMPALRAKSLRLTAQLRTLLQQKLGDQVEVITPRDPARHGCQLSLRLRGDGDHRKTVFHRLESHDVICDWREPDVIRVAPVPLYNSHIDVFRFVEVLEHLLSGQAR
jgi:kynureninase